MAATIKKRYLILLLIFVSIILYLFWGPLFPWNPIKIGYITINSSKATIYINDMTERYSVVYRINDIMQAEEIFHDLNYIDDFKIVILSKESNMKRYVPWLKGSGYSVSLSSLNLIYIGPIARNSQPGIEPYLKHELSHLLIGQNTTLDKALKIHEQGWFVEGIAEYFSGHDFYNKNELIMLLKMSNLRFNSLDENNPLNMSSEELKLRYSYYGFLIEPTTTLMRHPIWSNFDIPDKEFPKDKIRTAQIPQLQEKYGFDLSEYKLKNKRQVLRNCVEPELGKYILDLI